MTSFSCLWFTTLHFKWVPDASCASTVLAGKDLIPGVFTSADSFLQSPCLPGVHLYEEVSAFGQFPLKDSQAPLRDPATCGADSRGNSGPLVLSQNMLADPSLPAQELHRLPLCHPILAEYVPSTVLVRAGKNGSRREDTVDTTEVEQTGFIGCYHADLLFLPPFLYIF